MRKWRLELEIPKKILKSFRALIQPYTCKRCYEVVAVSLFLSFGIFKVSFGIFKVSLMGIRMIIL